MEVLDKGSKLNSIRVVHNFKNIHKCNYSFYHICINLYMFVDNILAVSF